MAIEARVAFLPITPLLIPEIATGAAGELDGIREAAKAAVDWACARTPTALLVPGDAVGDPDWSLPGFGLPVGSGTPVGLAEGIGRWLLDGRPATVVDPSGELAAFGSVLVMGDGSASRSERAPQHLHPGAQAFDEAVVDALAAGDHRTLARLDRGLAAEVGAAGAAAWTGVARQVSGVTDPVVDVVAEPYGVQYIVARWTVRWAAPA